MQVCCGSRSPRRRASTSTLRCSRPHTTRRPTWAFVRNGCSRTARASPSGPALPSSWVERHRKRARSSPDRRSCARSRRTGSDTRASPISSPHDSSGRAAARPDPTRQYRFLLPTLLGQDLRAVLRDLDEPGYPFQPEWFARFLAFHCPVVGGVQLGGASLELRLAHEPWPVLAEEPTGAGLARFVDAADERLQVRATGLAPSRYALACNGRRVPLRPTGVQGEWIAGVRYKAWNPPATLHPPT